MRHLWITCLVVGAIIGSSVWLAVDFDEYHASVVLPSATGLVSGSQVLVDGFRSGTIEDISTKDNKAVVRFGLDRDFTPLHDGAKAEIVWRAVLGERQVQITDGARSNPAIPDGGMVKGDMPDPVELDKVLNALDPSTRDHLSSLVKGLNATARGNETDLQDTLRTAGPALRSLGQVLDALGTDGPAIKNLVRQLGGMVGTLAERDAKVGRIVEELSHTTSVTATQRTQLLAALRKLPGTLRTADKTLGTVPGVADETTPLLRDLEPATKRLRSVSANLKPVLRDLRPTVAELRPTLSATSSLLRDTPALLDRAHAVLPDANSAFTWLKPALSFLRPYSPELMGWLSSWASASANYDSNGHYFRIMVQGGMSSLDANPGVLPPGFVSDPYPLPGSLASQPWTDAFGGAAR